MFTKADIRQSINQQLTEPITFHLVVCVRKEELHHWTFVCFLHTCMIRKRTARYFFPRAWFLFCIRMFDCWFLCETERKKNNPTTFSFDCPRNIIHIQCRKRKWNYWIFTNYNEMIRVIISVEFWMNMVSQIWFIILLFDLVKRSTFFHQIEKKKEISLAASERPNLFTNPSTNRRYLISSRLPDELIIIISCIIGVLLLAFLAFLVYHFRNQKSLRQTLLATRILATRGITNLKSVSSGWSKDVSFIASNCLNRINSIEMISIRKRNYRWSMMVLDGWLLMEQFQRWFHRIMMINVNFREKSNESNCEWVHRLLIELFV